MEDRYHTPQAKAGEIQPVDWVSSVLRYQDNKKVEEESK